MLPLARGRIPKYRLLFGLFADPAERSPHNPEVSHFVDVVGSQRYAVIKDLPLATRRCFSVLADWFGEEGETPPVKLKPSVDPSSRRHGPVFILCGPRTGSTLLRWLLDGHPDFYAPAETNIAGALQAIHQVLHIALAEDSVRAHSCAIEQARFFADNTLGMIAGERGASRWCDKSLPSVFLAEMLLEVFPSAQFISLYRNFPDFALSAKQASPWGYSGYGFEPYTSRGSALQGLAQYWIDFTSKELEFELAHPDVVLRLRYEDLALAPTATLTRLWTFLGASIPAESSSELLAKTHSIGPGDHKIEFTTEVMSTSVGKTEAFVPRDVIPTALLDRIDELHGALGYELHPDTWRFIDANDDVAGLRATSAPPRVIFDAFELLALLSSGIPSSNEPERSQAPIEFVVSSRKSPSRAPVAVRVLDAADGSTTSPVQLIMSDTTFEALAYGRDNMAEAVRQGRVLMRVPDELRNDISIIHQNILRCMRLLQSFPNTSLDIQTAPISSQLEEVSA
jgi:hypothetical protein